jgi:hypothetical protein
MMNFTPGRKSPGKSAGGEQRSQRCPSTKERILQIQRQIEDLKKRWPAHSVPPAMMQELDDLEAELAQEQEKAFLEEQRGKDGRYQNGNETP